MRPVLLALTGSEAMTLRAQVDLRIDSEIKLLDTMLPENKSVAFEHILALRSIRDKLDTALDVREAVIPVPF